MNQRNYTASSGSVPDWDGAAASTLGRADTLVTPGELPFRTRKDTLKSATQLGPTATASNPPQSQQDCESVVLSSTETLKGNSHFNSTDPAYHTDTIHSESMPRSVSSYPSSADRSIDMAVFTSPAAFKPLSLPQALASPSPAILLSYPKIRKASTQSAYTSSSHVVADLPSNAVRPVPSCADPTSNALMSFGSSLASPDTRVNSPKNCHYSEFPTESPDMLAQQRETHRKLLLEYERRTNQVKEQMHHEPSEKPLDARPDPSSSQPTKRKIASIHCNTSKAPFFFDIGIPTRELADYISMVTFAARMQELNHVLEEQATLADYAPMYRLGALVAVTVWTAACSIFLSLRLAPSISAGVAFGTMDILAISAGIVGFLAGAFAVKWSFLKDGCEYMRTLKSLQMKYTLIDAHHGLVWRLHWSYQPLQRPRSDASDPESAKNDHDVELEKATINPPWLSTRPVLPDLWVTVQKETYSLVARDGGFVMRPPLSSSTVQNTPRESFESRIDLGVPADWEVNGHGNVSGWVEQVDLCYLVDADTPPSVNLDFAFDEYGEAYMQNMMEFDRKTMAQNITGNETETGIEWIKSGLVTEYSSWATLASGVIQLLLLLLAERPTSRRFKPTPINIILVVMIITNAVTNVTYYLYEKMISDLVTSYVFLGISNFAYATMFISIFYYAWLRGYSVIEVVLPSALPWIPPLFALFALVEVVGGVVPVWSWFMTPEQRAVYDVWSSIQFAAQTVIISVFDVFIVCCYLCYLWQVSRIGVQVDTASLKTISNFGVASGVLLIISQAACYAAGWLTWEEETDFYLLMWILSLNLTTVYIYVQVWMKLQLVHEAKAVSAGKKDAIERAKKISNRASMSASVSVSMTSRNRRETLKEESISTIRPAL
ncbi:hypothetical protein HDU80_002971 [Chytriomyces hyalinus]|nr:hypothetical protein HDU80_002971 [Chytriomyces hyalinus]